MTSQERLVVAALAGAAAAVRFTARYISGEESLVWKRLSEELRLECETALRPDRSS